MLRPTPRDRPSGRARPRTPAAPPSPRSRQLRAADGFACIFSTRFCWRGRAELWKNTLTGKQERDRERVASVRAGAYIHIRYSGILFLPHTAVANHLHANSGHLFKPLPYLLIFVTATCGLLARQSPRSNSSVSFSSNRAEPARRSAGGGGRRWFGRRAACRTCRPVCSRSPARRGWPR